MNRRHEKRLIGGPQGRELSLDACVSRAKLLELEFPGQKGLPAKVAIRFRELSHLGATQAASFPAWKIAFDEVWDGMARDDWPKGPIRFSRTSASQTGGKAKLTMLALYD
jgi:hypothetical protein